MGGSLIFHFDVRCSRHNSLTKAYDSVMQCPICKKTIDEPAAGEPRRWLPFCSERCKLIDLGRWLDGRYQIPIAVSQEDEEGDLKPED